MKVELSDNLSIYLVLINTVNNILSYTEMSLTLMRNCMTLISLKTVHALEM